MAEGQAQLSAAGATPLASTTNNAITNGATSVNWETSVTVGELTIQT